MNCFVVHFLRPPRAQLGHVVLHIVAIALSFCLLVVPAFAVKLPEAVLEGGNTVIGTFITLSLPESNKAYLIEWMGSDRNILVRCPDGSYEFLIVPEGVTLSISPRSVGADLRFHGGLCSGLQMMGWEPNSPEFNGSVNQTYAAETGPSNCIIVSGTFFASAKVTLPMPTSGYVAEYDGQLQLQDDGGLFGAGGGEDSWLDQLREFFLWLLVPEDGYFDEWFQTVRIEVNKKLGSFIDLYESMMDFFAGIDKNENAPSSLMLRLPDDLLYPGYDGIEADAMPMIRQFAVKLRPFFNAIIVLLTAIVCYRRVVVLFEQ